MKNSNSNQKRWNNLVRSVYSIFLLTLVSFFASAQTPGQPGRGSDKPSQSQQANDYLHNFEKDPNGVPNDSVWYNQPWIWAIVAAVLILFIGLLVRNSGRKAIEHGSENGLR